MAEHLTTTPSGIEILFEDGLPDPATGKSKRRCYLVNGEKLPSVTTVLGILDKPALKFAAAKLDVAGAVALAQDGELPSTPEAALEAMKDRGLRFFQQWDRKADMGTLTHDDLLALVTGDELADTTGLAPDQEGLLRGAADWFAEWRPTAIDTETMVASVEHGFAGRHDFYGEVAKLPGRGLIDYKTTSELPRYKGGDVKPPYDEALLQLGAYEIGRRESGYEPSDWQAIVRIDSSGAHDTCVSWVDCDRFLAVLGAYKAVKGITTDRPRRAKAVA